MVDLFCGEAPTSEATGWSSAFWDRGHDVFTVDIDPQLQPSLAIDILDLKASDFPFKPDIILASPPCQGFSVASIQHHWFEGRPDSPKAHLALELVAATRRLISDAQPSFFVIENPRGMLRKQRVVADLERRYVTYCQYGRPYQKPTDLWGGFPPSLRLRPPCHRGGSCHEASPAGSGQTGVQSRQNRALAVQAIPYMLSHEVCLAAERDLPKI